MMKKISTTTILGIALALSFGFGTVAQAATSRVVFDAGTGTLSVSGSCSQRFVLVVIRRPSDGSIWGSSNPTCVNRQYAYAMSIPEADRTGNTFTVEVFDEASAGGSLPTSSVSGTGGVGPQQ